MLFGKSVVLGVTGGIAVYKSCEIVSRLKKLGCEVDVIMTSNAQEFVTPLTFQTLSKAPVVTDTFAPVKEFDVHHISLAKKADLFVVAPATANIIAKIANGIADDMLTTTILASKAKKLICPAMNTNMLEDPSTQNNIDILKSRGYLFEESPSGILACGDVGKGRMAEPEDIVNSIIKLLTPNQDYADKVVLVTAGATEENIDGVRVITNHSSGKMGCAIATAAAERGASVIFIHGNISCPLPKCLYKDIKVVSTIDMLNACETNFAEVDVAIMAAAPADYRLKKQFDNKIKSESLVLEFEKNPDIAKTLGENKGNKKLVIFSAETENLIDNASGKLLKKNADLVVANDVTMKGAGFNVDTNVATLIDKNKNKFETGLVLKTDLANIILDKVLEI